MKKMSSKPSLSKSRTATPAGIVSIWYLFGVAWFFSTNFTPAGLAMSVSFNLGRPGVGQRPRRKNCRDPVPDRGARRRTRTSRRDCISRSFSPGGPRDPSPERRYPRPGEEGDNGRVVGVSPQ